MYVAYIMSCNPEVQLVDKDWTEGSPRCMVLNIQFSHATAGPARKDSTRPRVTWNSTPEDGSAAPRRRAVNQTHSTQQSDFFFAPLIHSKHDSQMRGQLCRSFVAEPSKNRAVVLLLSYIRSWLSMILHAPPCQATILPLLAVEFAQYQSQVLKHDYPIRATKIKEKRETLLERLWHRT
jgi:hypothetical protein